MKVNEDKLSSSSSFYQRFTQKQHSNNKVCGHNTMVKPHSQPLSFVFLQNIREKNRENKSSHPPSPSSSSSSDLT